MAPEKLSTEGGSGLGHNPFASLDPTGLRSAPAIPQKPAPAPARAGAKDRGQGGRAAAETGGRGGKGRDGR